MATKPRYFIHVNNGTIKQWAWVPLEPGVIFLADHLECKGQLLAIIDFTRLYSFVGREFCTPDDPATHFRLPSFLQVEQHGLWFTTPKDPPAVPVTTSDYREASTWSHSEFDLFTRGAWRLIRSVDQPDHVIVQVMHDGKVYSARIPEQELTTALEGLK
jgi:microcystin-dependent protein